ncbi:MAG: sigma-54 dependent transcriptional regulator [Cyclobacteriaceae bacterium]
MKKILIIDDEQDICTLLKKFFSKNGFDAFTASTGKEGIKKIEDSDLDLVICDFKLPDYTGLEILQKIKIIKPSIQVIIITGYSDVRIAVDALKKGAFDYVTKPLYPEEILLTAERALETEHVEKKTSTKKVRQISGKAFITGTSRQSQGVQKHIDLIAPTDMSVIILGETGTGKEYAARAIHQKSKRKNSPFIAVDCGALPKDLAGSALFGHEKGAFTGAISEKKGCFELATGGTLFLDEIGNLTYENQIQLLRVLQEQVVKRVGGVKDIPVDVRVLVATNESLTELINSDEFREDIYHRLNEFKIELTPLRERPDDVALFASHFLEASNLELNKNVSGFDNQVSEIFRSYYWHGNLRELKNVVKRAVLLCQSDTIDESCLPPEIIEPQLGQSGELQIVFDGAIPSSLKEVAEAAEKSAIIEMLNQTNNNKSKTAKLLDVDRKTLYNKLKAYNIDI